MLHEGEAIGPYQIVEQLGSGGMATVYKAYHPKLDRYVAIKMMHQALLEDKSFRARFQREAQIVARLEHPNIIPVFDFSEHEGQPYLVMKYVEGRTLKEVLREDGPRSLDDIRRLMRQIADALSYAHERGVLHRDLKPSNIILDEHGTPYLTDFGLARMAQAGESTLSHDMLLGTPQYISPEQAKGGVELDERTDIYSLGVVLYELVVGQVPFNADTPYAIVHDHIYTPLPLPSRVNPDVPEAVERVLLRALAKRPSDRYSSAREMVADFEAALNSAGQVELKPDRDKTAALSLSQLLKDRASTDESVAPLVSIPSPSVPAAPPEPAALPDRDEDPEGYVRWHMENAIGEAGKAVEQIFGERAAERFSRIAEKVESKIEQKIEEGSIPVNRREARRKRKRGPQEPGDLLSDEAIRRRIEKRFNKRNEFYAHLGVFVAVNALLWIIWGFTGGFLGGLALFPWPIFPLMGWGSGLWAHAIDTYNQTGRRAEKYDQIVDETMAQEYGEDWNLVATEKEYQKTRRRVLKGMNKTIEFVQHLGVFVMINAMLWMIWGFAGGFLGGIATFPWPLIPMAGWGIGLVAHGIDTYAQSGRRMASREQAVQREIERLRYGYAEEDKPKRKHEDMERDVRLTEDGELTDSYAQEWDELENRKRR